MKSNSLISRSRHFSSKRIAVKSHLRISGSNIEAIESKACFGNRRKQNPAPCQRCQKLRLFGCRYTNLPTRASCPLHCGGSTDVPGQQCIYTCKSRVSCDGSQLSSDKFTASGFPNDITPFLALSCVDNVLNTRNCNRSFCNVCRKDAFPGTMWCAHKNLRLLGRVEGRIHRVHKDLDGL